VVVSGIVWLFLRRLKSGVESEWQLKIVDRSKGGIGTKF
jgi:hypothetical protein